MEPQVVRYSERPELWDAIETLSDEVWPEYNQHGDIWIIHEARGGPGF